MWGLVLALLASLLGLVACKGSQVPVQHAETTAPAATPTAPEVMPTVTLMPEASPTPEPMSKDAVASALTAGTAYSAESTTFVTNVFQLFSFNQRGGMRWAVPVNEGFRPDPVTNFSFAWRVISSTAGAIDGNALWWE